MKDLISGIIILVMIILLFLTVILFIAAYWFLASAMLMIAWNYVMPYAFDLPKLELLHAFCLLVISKILLSITMTTKNGNKKTKN